MEESSMINYTAVILTESLTNCMSSTCRLVGLRLRYDPGLGYYGSVPLDAKSIIS